jgi:hypothetical protein
MATHRAPSRQSVKGKHFGKYTDHLPSRKTGTASIPTESLNIFFSLCLHKTQAFKLKNI